MIELITALALFILIFVMLLTILRSANRLWSPDQSAAQLQARGDTVTDILANDFYQAVADNWNVRGQNDKPTFVVDCDTNALANAAGTPHLALYFARHASPRTPLATGDPTQRLSLDAVFYVLYKDCLSRHAYPLFRAWDEDATETLGDLLEKELGKLDGAIVGIYDWFADPIKNPPPTEGLHSLLAERCEFAIVATITPDMLKDSPYDASAMPLVGTYQFEAYAVPDFLDVALMLYSEQDWIALHQQPSPSASQTDERMRLEHLGTPFSKRIAYPAKGGARL
ncbi:MAG: hypothetical protein FWG50_02100 [Kiritimatiellaeota bacterium]|nr:hypothetical protein [Kiritimatiellota bacterium]